MTQKEVSFVKILDDLTRFFKGDTRKVFLWLNTKNPLLGDIRPVDFVNADGIRKLRDFIDIQLSENRPEK